MKKVISLLMVLVLMAMSVSATTVDVSWSGSGSVDTQMSNSLSYAHLWGAGNTINGYFQADDDNYDRVEVTGSESDYTFGTWQFDQWNDLTAGNGGQSNTMMYTSGDYGFLNFNTDEWRQGNSLRTEGYGGDSWSWSGTDEPIVGASGTSYMVGVRGTWDSDEDGIPESVFDSTVSGNGNAGLGTWKAGSTSVLSANGPVSANLLTKGSGSATWSQTLQNTGTVIGSYQWN